MECTSPISTVFGLSGDLRKAAEDIFISKNFWLDQGFYDVFITVLCFVTFLVKYFVTYVCEKWYE